MSGLKCLHLIPFLWLQRYSSSNHSSLFSTSLTSVGNNHCNQVNHSPSSAKLSKGVKFPLDPASTRGVGSAAEKNIEKRMDNIKDVEIDSRGKFKYILITVKDVDSGSSKVIVRGYRDCGYHADILERVQSQYPSLVCDSPGGGRILHEPDSKKIQVYGYSMGFGRADHKVAVDLLKKAYPDYTIEWSNEGY